MFTVHKGLMKTEGEGERGRGREVGRNFRYFNLY